MNDVLLFAVAILLFLTFCVLVIADNPDGGCRNSAQKYTAVSQAYSEIAKPDTWVDAPQEAAAKELFRLKEHSRREMISSCS